MKKTAVLVLATALVVGGGAAIIVWQTSTAEVPNNSLNPNHVVAAPADANAESIHLNGQRGAIPTPGSTQPIVVPSLSRNDDYRSSLTFEETEKSAGGSIEEAIPVPDSRPLSRSELLSRAQAVQDATERRLQKLAADLDLTEDQQDHLFSVIARSSPSYHPSLQIGVVGTSPTGTAGGEFVDIQPINSGAAPDGTGGPVRASSQRTVDDLIFDVLAEDQAEVLTEQILERDQWWTDIVQLLEQDFDASVTNGAVVSQPVEGDGSTTAPAPDNGAPPSGEPRESTSQTHGGGNLRDLLDGK